MEVGEGKKLEEEVVGVKCGRRGERDRRRGVGGGYGR